MIIENVLKEKELIIKVEGRLDSATGDEFEKNIEENFNEQVEKITFDFENVDFISSKGLRILVATYKELNGRKMEVINSNSSVKEIFRISGFVELFNVK